MYVVVDMVGSFFGRTYFLNIMFHRGAIVLHNGECQSEPIRPPSASIAINVIEQHNPDTRNNVVPQGGGLHPVLNKINSSACILQYKPVCGKDGQTYASPCVAEER